MFWVSVSLEKASSNFFIDLELSTIEEKTQTMKAPTDRGVEDLGLRQGPPEEELQSQ